jgi:cytochrome c oxidase subunit III
MPNRRAQLVQDRRSEQGAWLFIASLAVFFVGSIVLYAVYVLIRTAPGVDVIPFYLPLNFVTTSVNLIAISVLLHLAVGAARTERHVDLSRYIVLAFILSIVFFFIQGSGLMWMLDRMVVPASTITNFYGLTFFLVIVHALHVVGGVAGLVLLLFGLRRHAYDHERNFPVRFCALYWHFLDVVWILMLFSFGLAAYVSRS